MTQMQSLIGNMSELISTSNSWALLSFFLRIFSKSNMLELDSVRLLTFLRRVEFTLVVVNDFIVVFSATF